MKYILTIALALVCVCLFGQDTIAVDTIVTAPIKTLPVLADWFDEGMGVAITALTILFGYLSKWIPIFNKIDDVTLRVLAFAVLAGAGFVYFGADIYQVAISYFMATSMYEVIFKKIFGASPPVEKT